MPKSKGSSDPEIVEIRKAVGERIKAARGRSPYKTARAFANAVGVSPSTLTSWEKGRAFPGVENLLQVSKLTGESVGFLLPSKLRASDSLEAYSIALGSILGHRRMERLLAMPKTAVKRAANEAIGDFIAEQEDTDSRPRTKSGRSRQIH